MKNNFYPHGQHIKLGPRAKLHLFFYSDQHARAFIEAYPIYSERSGMKTDGDNVWFDGRPTFYAAAPKRRWFKFKLRCLLLWDRAVRFVLCNRLVDLHDEVFTEETEYDLTYAHYVCKRCGEITL